MALGKRIQQRLDEISMSPAELTKSLGFKNNSTIHNIIARDAKSTTHAKNISDALGVRLAWLTDGEEPMLAPVKVYAYDIDAYEDTAEISDDHALIPLYDVHLSAGVGAAGYDFVETTYSLPFRIDWLNSVGVNKRKVKMMKVMGNSMYPVLGDGDKVLVDTGDTTVQNNKVYALVIGDEVFVKRLRKVYDGGLEVISDNAAEFDKITVPVKDMDYIQIIGRVFHKLGDTGL